MLKRRSAEARREMMLNGRLSRIIPLMAVPSVISTLVTSFYNLADSFFVSQLGSDAIGAVGLSFTLDNIITMFGMAIGTGAASYISRLLGANRKRDAEETLAMPIGATVVVINMTLTSLGKATSALILGLARQGICYVPMVLLLPRLFGVYGLAAAGDVLPVFIGIPLAVLLLRTVRMKLKEQREGILDTIQSDA